MDEQELDVGLLTDDPVAEPAPPIPPEQFVAWVTGAENIAAELTQGELDTIARNAVDDYKMDKDSMSTWLQQMERGIKLATLAKERKTYPFDDAANVKYPLVTSAALQFNARSYPAIVPDDRVVKAKVWGADPSGGKAARADRVSEFMSWQLSSKVTEWEPETDKLLTILPIVGECHRKWWFDPVANRARCRLIEPGKLIVNDKVKCLDDAPRVTEEIPLFPVEIESRIRSGQFVSFEYTDASDDTQGPQDFIEQHTRIDLDLDGYEEPYIVTVHVDTMTVVRLIADFAPEDVAYQREMVATEVMAPVVVDPMTGTTVDVPQVVEQEVVTGIISIPRGSYFVDFQFMPGMDGGYHGTGLGLLLGDISDAINGIINTLLDAGHYASLGGGFIGGEVRLKGGAQRIRPGEWRMIPASGDDIRKAMMPMTFPGPDAVLFQMLGMLIDAGREIASVKDVITGEAPRQQTATTTLALIEQGMMVFTAAYKRIFRALKREYQLVAKLNAQTVTPEEYNAFHDGQQPYDPAADFGAADVDVEPVADPRSVTKMQEAAKAQLVMQMAEQGLVDKAEATKRVAQSADIPDFEQLIPKPDQAQMMMQQMQMAGAETQLMQARVDVELTLAKVESERAKAMKDLSEVQAGEVGLRLDALRMMLEDRRARMDQLLGAAGGMAGAPGDAGAARGAGQGAGGQAAGAGGPMAGFGINPGSGGPAFGPAAGAGNARGLV